MGWVVSAFLFLSLLLKYSVAHNWLMVVLMSVGLLGAIVNIFFDWSERR